MADDKKPRKLKNLRARLGKTGGAAAPPGPGAPSGDAAPPPGIGKGLKGGPAFGAGTGGAAANPFAPKPKAAEKSADPFAAATPGDGPREVRIVMDETPVEDAEIGRKRKGVVAALLIGGLVVGFGVSFALGVVNNQRLRWNEGVRAAKALNRGVQATAERLAEAQTHVDTLLATAKGGPGKQQAVDYDAVESIVALINPTKDNPFSLSQNYRLLKGSTIGGVQAYYQQVAEFWEKLDTLRVHTGESRREALNSAAAARANLARPIGCVPEVVDNRFVCSLGFIFITEGGTPGSVKVGPRATSSERRQEEKTVFTGLGTALETAPSDHVIIVNNEKSVGVLGQPAREFAQYQQLLLEMQRILEKANELQGQVETSLGEVAAYEERFALFDSSSNDDGGH